MAANWRNLGYVLRSVHGRYGATPGDGRLAILDCNSSGWAFIEFDAVELVITATPGAETMSVAGSATPERAITSSTASATPTIMDFTLADARHLTGDPDALVTMIEFSDFKCPFCGRFSAETLPSIREQYVDPGKVRSVYRHFAILGPELERTAEASECAADQGQFWAYHDRVFADQTTAHSTLDDARLIELAAEVDLDRASFEECLASGRHNNRVKQQTQTAGSFGGCTPCWPTCRPPLTWPRFFMEASPLAKKRR